MLARQVINNLIMGELAQLSIVDKLTAGDYEMFIASLNMGLTALHRRFPLNSTDVFVRQQDHIATYFLKDEFKASNTGSTQPYKYIDDSVYEPFEAARLISVIEIQDERGDPLYVNDDHSTSNIYMPSYNTIVCDSPISDNAWRVFYTRDHKLISNVNFDPDTQEIDIPSAYLEPLLYYIASRHHSGAGKLTPNNMADSYLMKFEAACQELDKANIVKRDFLTNVKLGDNGWV